VPFQCYRTQLGMLQSLSSSAQKKTTAVFWDIWLLSPKLRASRICFQLLQEVDQISFPSGDQQEKGKALSRRHRTSESSALAVPTRNIFTPIRTIKVETKSTPKTEYPVYLKFTKKEAWKAIILKSWPILSTSFPSKGSPNILQRARFHCWAW